MADLYAFTENKERDAVSNDDNLAGILTAINTLTTTINEYWKKVYPVGAIYMSTAQTNPGSLFGGTWVAWGSGRVPVGVAANDTDFNTVEKTGGNKALAAHNHTFNAVFDIRDAATGAQNIWGVRNTNIARNAGENENATVYLDSGNSKADRVTINGNTGSSGTGNSGNLQPYITCYMWKRTA